MTPAMRCRVALVDDEPPALRRFEAALQRGREEVARRAGRTLPPRLSRLLAHHADPDATPDRLIATTGPGRVVLLDPTEVDWIEAAGNYLRLHGRDGEALLRETMRSAAARLAASAFLRVHRSRLVRLGAVRAWHADPELTLVLRDGTTVGVSRQHVAEVRARLGL